MYLRMDCIDIKCLLIVRIGRHFLIWVEGPARSGDFQKQGRHEPGNSRISIK